MGKMSEIAADLNALDEPRIIPFNALAAYERERDHSRRMETYLAKALLLLTMECSRRELRGEDVSHIRSFVTEASQ